MSASDVPDSVLLASASTGLDYAWVEHRLHLLTDNGTCYVSGELRPFREQNYFLPTELETEIASFVKYYNYQRYHESLDDLTPLTFILAEPRRC